MGLSTIIQPFNCKLLVAQRGLASATSAIQAITGVEIIKTTQIRKRWCLHLTINVTATDSLLRQIGQYGRWC